MESDITQPARRSLMVPGAILVALIIIAATAYFNLSGSASPTGTNASSTPAVVLKKNVPPVTAADHIQGSLTAPVTLVEYADLDSAFSKTFDGTMRQITQAYPDKVAWVMREFPLVTLHPNAPRLALAAECIAALQGNDAFWQFKSALFENAPGALPFDMTKLTATAEGVGADGKKFDTCIAAGTYTTLVTKEFNDAVAAGALGTPFSVLITPDGAQVPIAGAQSFENIKAAIDAALGN